MDSNIKRLNNDFNTILRALETNSIHLLRVALEQVKINLSEDNQNEILSIYSDNFNNVIKVYVDTLFEEVNNYFEDNIYIAKSYNSSNKYKLISDNLKNIIDLLNSSKNLSKRLYIKARESKIDKKIIEESNKIMDNSLNSVINEINKVSKSILVKAHKLFLYSSKYYNNDSLESLKNISFNMVHQNINNIADRYLMDSGEKTVNKFKTMNENLFDIDMTNNKMMDILDYYLKLILTNIKSTYSMNTKYYYMQNRILHENDLIENFENQSNDIKINLYSEHTLSEVLVAPSDIDIEKIISNLIIIGVENNITINESLLRKMLINFSDSVTDSAITDIKNMKDELNYTRQLILLATNNVFINDVENIEVYNDKTIKQKIEVEYDRLNLVLENENKKHSI